MPQSFRKPHMPALIAVVALLLAGGFFYLIRRSMPPPEPQSPPVEAARHSPSPPPVTTGATPAIPAVEEPALEPSAVVRVVFHPSGAPAAGVLLRWHGGIESVVDSEGLVTLPAELSGFDAFDPETGLLLAEAMAAPTAGEQIVVPQPVRLLADVQPAMTIQAGGSFQLGHGPRVPAAARMRREQAITISPLPHEDAPYGFPLPETAEHWVDIEEFPDGERLLTPWFPFPSGAPQIAGWDAEGRFGILDVVWPESLPPREAVNAGTLHMIPAAVLEVTLEIPPGEIASAIGLGVASQTADPADPLHAAHVLALLDRADPPLSNWIRRAGDYNLARGGVTVLQPLPALGRIDVVARGVLPDLIAHRTIDLRSGEITRIEFAMEELFPVVRSTVTYAGTVMLEGTSMPVEGAIITSTWTRTRAQAVTDSEGRYELAGIPTEHPLTFTIEAYDEQDPPRYSHTETLRPPPLPRDAEDQTLDWEVPGYRWMIVEGFPGGAAPGPHDHPITLELFEGGQWVPFREVLDFYFEPDAIEIEIRRPGRYRAVVPLDAFVVYHTEPANFGEDDWEIVVGLAVPDPVREETVLRVTDAAGLPVAGASAIISLPNPGSLPLEVETDSNGTIPLGPSNVPALDVRIVSESGCYEGLVELQVRGAAVEVRLGECE